MVEQPPPMYRVAYGDQELEFMVPPWFEVGVLSGGPGDTAFDVVVVGLETPNDSTLDAALRAVMSVGPRRLVRPGGAIVLAAQLDEGPGADGVDAELETELALTLQHCLVVVAASEEPEIVRLAKLRAAVDVEEGLDIAYEHIGRPPRASLLIVPRAPHTLPVVTTAAGVHGGGGPRVG